MWGIFHFLDYHHWHNIKKTPPIRRKHGRRRHGRRKHSICFGNPKTVSFHGAGAQEYLHAEAVPLLVEEQTKKANPTNRISGKDRIKALIADEMSKRSRLLQTRSVHYLESRYDGLDRTSTDWTNQVIILHSNADNPGGYSKQNLLSSRHAFSSEKIDESGNTTSVDKLVSREFSYPQFKECADVLEIFKLNKKSFLEMIQNPDVQSMRDILYTSNDKGRLWRSGSFPAADASRLRYLKPSRIEHKQKEIWSFPKGQKLPIGAQSSKFIPSNSLDDSHEASVSSTTDSTFPTETAVDSLASSQRLVKHGWKSSFLSHFKDIKKKLKYALREYKKVSRHGLTNERVLKVLRHESSIDDREMSEKLEENKAHQGVVESFQTNNSDTDLGQSQLRNIRRASSVNESINRYTELLEKSFGREVKWHQRQSRSLKLSSEDRSSSTGNDLKYFRRRLSLPELESFFPMTNEVNSQTTTRAVRDGGTIAEKDGHNDLKSATITLDRKMSDSLDAIEVTELHKSITDSFQGAENYEYSGGLMESIDEANENEVKAEYQFEAHAGQKVGTTIYHNGANEGQSPVSVLKTHSHDDTSNPIESPAVEGAELHDHTEKPDCSIIEEDCSHQDSSSECCHTTKPKDVENTNKRVDSHFLKFDSNIQEEDADLSYVRDVLETSGFLDKEQVVTWYSMNQPISPTLFKELEAYIHHQQETSSEEADHDDCDHHHLLFDLINQELLNIYESSLAYFPKHMSTTSGPARPLPKGSRVLEEVRKMVKWYKSSRSSDQSLDDIVERDFAKGDGWLNLCFDVEDVTLDLEEWILDELLAEVMS